MKHIQQLTLLLLCLTGYLQATELKQHETDVHVQYSVAQMQQLLEEYKDSEQLNDYWQVEDKIPELGAKELVTSKNCADILTRLHAGLKQHFMSLSLHKLALTCHHILQQDQQASSHENNLITISAIITQSGDGTTYKKALWISDIGSAYIFLQLAGYNVIDAELSIENDKVYLLTYIRDKKLFGQYKAFDVSDYISKIERIYQEEDLKWSSYLNIILKSKLKNHDSIIALAVAGMSEAQILLGNTLINNAKDFKGLYPNVIELYKMAADDGSAIGQYHYAQRIFIDQIEDSYAQAHSYLTDAIEQRYQKALVLAIIVREKGLGIKADDSTVADLISLASLETDSPGLMEYKIAESYRNKNQWDNIDLAHKYYLKSAAKGYELGIVAVGNDYYFGRSVKQDRIAAFNWFTKATKNKDPKAGYLEVANAYLFGQGVKKDLDKAIEYNEKAAALESTVAYNNLGKLYYYKDNKHQDYQQAKKWFDKGMETESLVSRYYLGLMYFFGHGVKQDYQKAHDYIDQAKELEYFDPYLYLGVMSEKGLGTDQDKAKAKEYYKKSMAIKLNNFARLNLELIDVTGHEPLLNHDDYLQELKAKADTNDPIAMYQYSNFLEFNFFQKNVKWLKMLKKSGKLGLSHAYLQLASSYRVFGMQMSKAKKYYKLAYELGNADAATALAKIHLKKDKTEKALQELNFAVSKNHPEATYLLANLYELGDTVAQNTSKSISLYKKALDLGYDLAVYKLVPLYLAKNSKAADVDTAVSMLKDIVEKSNYRMAKRNLGEIYSNPRYQGFDNDEAIQWLVDASSHGDGYSSLLLGKMFLYGKHVSQNFDTAQFFFADSAYKENTESIYWLGLMFERGYGVDIDYDIARAFYQNSQNNKRKKQALNNLNVLACQNKGKRNRKLTPYKTLASLSENSRTALFNLGWIAEHGTCRHKNSKKALKFYQLAADKKSPHALYRMYQLYDQGILVEKDPQKAQEYLQKAQESFTKMRIPAMMTTFMSLPIERQEKEED